MKTLRSKSPSGAARPDSAGRTRRAGPEARRSPLALDAAGRRGAALLVSLVAVTVAAMFMATILQLTAMTARRQARAIDDERAFYLCEAGLSEAMEAIRVGKRGQIGSIAAPARFGDGVVWVDATPAPDGQMRLESTAVCGTGSKTLAVVLQPEEQQLGIFSLDELVLDSVVLVDGFNSEEGGYFEQTLGDRVTVDRSDPYLHVDEEHKLLFYEGSFFRYTDVVGDDYYYDHVVSLETLSETQIGVLFDIDPEDFTDHDPEEHEFSPDFEDDEYEGVLAYYDELEGSLAEAVDIIQDATEDTYAGGLLGWGDWSSSRWDTTSTTTQSSGGWFGGFLDEPAEVEVAVTTSSLGVTTGGGGILGSNGPITLGADSTEIFGDLVPGVGEDVTVAAGSLVTGDTEARLENVELPTVTVPTPPSTLPPTVHDSAYPMIVSPGSVGFERLEVRSDSELVIRGPAQVVIGELELAPGAELVLDTTDGNVELDFTQSMILSPSSVVSTSGVRPEELSVNVSAELPLPGGAPVQLLADSRFYGTIYAPGAEVQIGSEFELFGGVVAKSLDLEPGARLHYDAEGSDALPKLISWRIIEVPTAAQGGLSRLEFEEDDVLPLALAHDLGGIELRLDYTDVNGVERSFSGAESGFDWSTVAEVSSQERSGWDKWDSGWWNDWWELWGSDWWSSSGSDWSSSWGSNWSPGDGSSWSWGG